MGGRGTLANAPTPEELEFLEAMQRLIANPYFQLLAVGVEAERDKYITALARHSVMGGGVKAPPVDQREVDYKRGFWNGALFAVTQFPAQKAMGWEKFVAKTVKESE